MSETTFTLKPRLFKPTGGKFQHDIAVMLDKHPLAFDCIIFPAKHSDFDEQISDNTPSITMLDRDERLQTYDPPVLARAMIIPEGDDILFGLGESGSFENFADMAQPMRIIVSVPDLRTYSLIQWKEYEEHSSDVIVDRTVYIASSLPIGRGLNCWTLHLCHPMLAGGDIPKTETVADESERAKIEEEQEETAADYAPIDFSSMEDLMKNVEEEQ